MIILIDPLLLKKNLLNSIFDRLKLVSIILSLTGVSNYSFETSTYNSSVYLREKCMKFNYFFIWGLKIYRCILEQLLLSPELPQQPMVDYISDQGLTFNMTVLLL